MAQGCRNWGQGWTVPPPPLSFLQSVDPTSTGGAIMPTTLQRYYGPIYVLYVYNGKKYDLIQAI